MYAASMLVNRQKYGGKILLGRRDLVKENPDLSGLVKHTLKVNERTTPREEGGSKTTYGAYQQLQTE
jgi:hypothetical protein